MFTKFNWPRKHFSIYSLKYIIIVRKIANFLSLVHHTLQSMIYFQLVSVLILIYKIITIFKLK